MPIVELFGREYTIPFDPEVIAGYQYRGVNVAPDPGTKPDQINAEALQIKTHLDKLWADQEMRTVPGNRLNRNFSPPSVDEGMTADGGHPLSTIPKGNNELMLRKVLPTPKTRFNLRDIVPAPGVGFKKPLSTDL